MGGVISQGQARQRCLVPETLVRLSREDRGKHTRFGGERKMDRPLMTYDRRAPAPLVAALSSGGFARALVEYGRSGNHALDLFCRGNPGKGHWASLYVGLTKVLDLHCAGHGPGVEDAVFRLDAHTKWKSLGGWDPSWDGPHEGGFDQSTWRAVDDYIERVVPKVGPGFARRGMSRRRSVPFTHGTPPSSTERSPSVSQATKQRRRSSMNLQSLFCPPSSQSPATLRGFTGSRDRRAWVASVTPSRCVPTAPSSL